MVTRSAGWINRAASDFKAALPHTKPPYSSRAWGHAFHSLSSYQGKLKPSLAHWLVANFTEPGARVLDPLGGVGTIAFEAALQGRIGLTNDLSPFASCVARAKLAPPDGAALFAVLKAFDRDMDQKILNSRDRAAAEFGLNAAVKDYYHPDTLDEILKARTILAGNDLPAEQNFLKACLLHILHGNRPYALSRTSHPITPFSPTGPFEYRSVLDRLRNRCDRLARVEWPDSFIPGQSLNSDFRSLPELVSNPVDAIICSPPFPGMRFDRPNWLRMWFCGWLASDFHETSKDFLERQQGKGLAVYHEFFQVCRAVTRPKSPIILHVGGSKGYDMAEKLTTIGSKTLNHVFTVTEDVSHIERHGITDKGSTSSHILLFFQRPD